MINKTLNIYVKNFFNKNFVKRALAISVIFFIAKVINHYRLGVIKINESSQKAFGLDIAEKIGFFDVIENSGMHFSTIIILTIILFFIPTIAFFHLLTLRVFTEVNQGWKRLCIFSLIMSFIYVLTIPYEKSYFFIARLADIYIVFIITSLFILSIIGGLKWIIMGFKESSKIP